MSITNQQKTLSQGGAEAFFSFITPFIPADLPVVLRGDKKGYALSVNGEELALPATLDVIQAWIKQQDKAPKNLIYADYTLDQAHRKLFSLKGEEISLTEKETLLLGLFFQHVGKVFSKKDLLTDVWGWVEEVQTHTIESHIYALRQKCPDLPITAGAEGYYLPPQ